MQKIRKEIDRKNHKFLITAFLLVGFIIGAVLLITASGQFTNSLEDMGGEIPQKIKSTQETYFRKNEALLKTVAVKIQELKEENRRNINKDQLEKVINNYGKILEVDNAKIYAVIDNKYYTADNQENEQDYTKTEWYQKVKETNNGEIIYTNAKYSSQTKEPIVTAAMKIAGTNDMLAIDIFPERIATWSDIEIFPKGTSYYITDAAGNIIHQGDSEQNTKTNQEEKHIDEIYSKLKIKEEEIVNLSSESERISSRAGLYTIETYNGWKILVKTSYGDMLNSTRIILIAYYSTTVLFSILILYLAFSERRAEKGKSLYSRITNVLSDSYYALYLVDFEKEEYTILKGSEYIQSIPQTGDYNSFVEFTQNIMEKEAYEEFKETFSIENIRRLVRNNVKSFGGDFRRAFNSEFKWVNVRMLYSEEYVRKNRTEVIFAFQDADARKEKELEEKEVLRESLVAMRSATQTKNRFFSNMSHDMRTPLNAIINFSNMAISQPDDKERVMDYLRKINISSSQLLELINNILEVSRIEENMPLITKTQFNIAKSLEDTLMVFKEQAFIQHKNFEIECNIKHDYVLSDWGKIRQIINNIVSNALKYTRKGGNVRVEINEIEGKFVSKYTFRIVDDGIGMSKEFLKKIYVPFERETRFHSEEMNGTGLGMVIVQNNVQTLNGQIEINSEPGKGSEISIVLPLETIKEIEEENKDESKEYLQELKGKRILLVEDNELNMEIATEILEMQGVKITQAFDGKQAVDIFRNSVEGYFDAILMDVQMPVMDGYEATSCIRRLPRRDARSVVILAVTANAFADDIIQAEKAGMNEHISKPIDFKELQKALTKFMKKG